MSVEEWTTLQEALLYVFTRLGVTAAAVLLVLEIGVGGVVMMLQIFFGKKAPR